MVEFFEDAVQDVAVRNKGVKKFTAVYLDDSGLVKFDSPYWGEYEHGIIPSRIRLITTNGNLTTWKVTATRGDWLPNFYC
jgi:hypothetical protein